MKNSPNNEIKETQLLVVVTKFSPFLTIFGELYSSTNESVVVW